MAGEQKKILPIDYTNREFQTIREDLLQIAERFYPDTFQDFSEASFGALMIDAVAYVGDQLSFYLDYNVNEAFLDTAYQYNNIVRHGRILGYKNQGRPSTYGQVAIFVLVPASTTGIGPDENYVPILKRGSTLQSQSGLNFMLTENIDFNDPKNPVVVARVNDSTGAPTYFAIKAFGNVVSGQIGQQIIKSGPYERFKTITINDSNFAEIISVYDSEGNEYFEVDYLSQDMVFKEFTNKNFKNDNVPSIIKPYLVSRKFVVVNERFETFLQFGSGKEGDSNVVASPQSVALNIFGKSYTSDTTFDPTRLTKTENFGIVPTNTTLTVTYRAINPINSNIAANSLTKVTNPRVEFADRTILSTRKISDVLSSFEASNELPIVGDVSMPSSVEIKQRIYDTFPTQNRAVTQADYESLCYRMPVKFGSIKRVSAQKDPDSLKRNINMYVISEDSFGKLTLSNATIKDNLKTWLNQYRMINDTIDILDPYVINVGIEFILKAAPTAEKYSLLESTVSAIQDKYNTAFFIGEHLYISDIYQALKEIVGVLDVVKVKIVNKSGANYSSNIIDIERNLSPDGDYLVVPKNAVLEIKYPKVDIVGKIR
jgi:uncharacterized phage protein gp47/JayE